MRAWVCVRVLCVCVCSVQRCLFCIERNPTATDLISDCVELITNKQQQQKQHTQKQPTCRAYSALQQHIHSDTCWCAALLRHTRQHKKKGYTEFAARHQPASQPTIPTE